MLAFQDKKGGWIEKPFRDCYGSGELCMEVQVMTLTLEKSFASRHSVPLSCYLELIFNVGRVLLTYQNYLLILEVVRMNISWASPCKTFLFFIKTTRNTEIPPCARTGSQPFNKNSL